MKHAYSQFGPTLNALEDRKKLVEETRIQNENRDKMRFFETKDKVQKRCTDNGTNKMDGNMKRIMICRLYASVATSTGGEGGKENSPNVGWLFFFARKKN